ncbi:MAG: NUDIX hydrolase [Bacteroidales bacterium]
MKIFLNDRVIEFLAKAPEHPLNSDVVTEYKTEEGLRTVWDEFYRYEKFRNLYIIEPGFCSFGNSVAFHVFSSFFKIIHAAGGLVMNEKGEYLFIHRLGFWDLPKGKIDKKDLPGAGYSREDLQTARVAAIREVKEETGLKKVVITKELGATWHLYTVKEKIVLKKTQWFGMEADSAQPLQPEIREGIFLAKWTSPKAIHCILSHTYASIRELVLEVLF